MTCPFATGVYGEDDEKSSEPDGQTLAHPAPAVYTRPPMPLSSLVLAALLSLSPIDGPRLAYPGFAETPWERGVRYLSIASDIATAAEGACGTRGEVCEHNAAALLIGLAWHESGFAPDVDAGRCYRGRDGRGPRCDGGRAVSLWQLQGSAEERALWGGDRVQAARAALRRAWRSMNACRGKVAPDETLAVYASGRCDNETGKTRARELAASVRRASAMIRAATSDASP